MARRKTQGEQPSETLLLSDEDHGDVTGVDGAGPDEANKASTAADAADEAPQKVVPAAAEPKHEDIGNWEAIHWRGRPMWKHKRNGRTQHKRQEVWRERNLK